jgi:hypothetical protein
MRLLRAEGHDAVMSTHPSSIIGRRPFPRRAFVLGFLAGFLIRVPAVLLALLFPLAERLLPVLTPGNVLLRPLSSAMGDWPVGVIMLLASLANGLVVGLLVAAVALLVSRLR